jgi:hypothetical protein
VVWIYVTLGVALIGLAVLGWYVFVLYRKLAALFAELAALTDRAAEALDLVARIEIPDRLGGRYDASFGPGSESRFDTGFDTDLEADDLDRYGAPGLRGNPQIKPGARAARRT